MDLLGAALFPGSPPLRLHLRALQIVGVLLVLVSTTTLVLAQDQPIDQCSNECPEKASSLDTCLSLIGYFLSGLLTLFPWVRLIRKKNGHENVSSDLWFMGFLYFSALDFIAWTGFSLKKCRYCDAAPFMLMSSVVGSTVTTVGFVFGIFTEQGRLTGEHSKVVFILVFVCGAGVLSGLTSYKSSRGYHALVGAVVAHICRWIATDCTQFSRSQFLISILGAIAGLLCIRHPHLFHRDHAKPYWISTVVVGSMRLLEAVWWIIIWFRRTPSPAPRHHSRQQVVQLVAISDGSRP